MAALEITFDAHGLLAKAQAAPERIDRELRRTIEYSALDVEGAVVANTPVGATGHLRQSITHDVRGSGVSLVGRVYSHDQPVKVASVEHGARPHWAPIAPLMRWTRAKLGSEQAAYALQRAIAVRGTRAHGMFHKGFAQARPKVEARFRALAASLREVL